jgi:hypothetical protein
MDEKRKVILRKLNGEVLKGYIEGTPDLLTADQLTIVSLTEQEIQISKRDVKALFFVRKFSGDKEYSEVKFFESQPKIDGLWVRLHFLDSESIEGIVANTIKFLVEDGFYLKPPDPNSNNRLMFVVKSALVDFTVLGVQYSKGDITQYYDRSLKEKGPDDKSKT